MSEFNEKSNLATLKYNLFESEYYREDKMDFSELSNDKMSEKQDPKLNVSVIEGVPLKEYVSIKLYL